MAVAAINPDPTMTHATVPATREFSGMILVFFAGVLWSTVGLGIRMIEDAIVWQILLYRSVGLAVLLYLVIRLRSGRGPFEMARRSGLPGVLGALALVAAYTGAIYAIQTTSVANAMLLFASSPLQAALFGRLLLAERMRPATWGAMAVGAAGIAVMVWDKAGTSAWSGNLAALGSATGFAVFTVSLRWGRSAEMLPAVFLSGLLAIVITGGVCLVSGLPLILSVNDGGIAVGMGVFQVGAGLVLYTIGSRTVPAVELTILSMAEVVLGPFWVWLLLGETISPFTLAGGAILLLAIAGNALSGARRKPPPGIV